MAETWRLRYGPEDGRLVTITFRGPDGEVYRSGTIVYMPSGEHDELGNRVAYGWED